MKELLNQFPKRSPEQWIIQGLIEMENTSFIDLKVEVLAENLGLTRGSFYHHFKNKNDYLKALLNFWKKETTEKALKYIPQIQGNLREKFKKLELFLYDNQILSIERSIRQSISSPLVITYFKKMDPLRISLMVQFFIDDGYSLDEAEFRSRMIYHIQIGEIIKFDSKTKPSSFLNELEQRLDFYFS